MNELERVKAERDAAVADIHKIAHILRVCQFCKHGDRDSEACRAKREKNNVSCFEWRGWKPKLKPCPFCGSVTAPKCLTICDANGIDEDSPNYEWDASHYTVVCEFNAGGCGASIGFRYDTEEEAIVEWNRRAE